MKGKKKMKYVAIEGLEGAGKSTATKAILDFFKENGKTEDDLCLTREPGGTPLAEELRNLVKKEHENETVDAYSETLMFFAARNQLIQNVIKPALDNGKTVISDRCYLTGVAYQQKESELVQTLVKTLKKVPDCIIYLDIDPRIGLERARGRGELDRIEKNNISYFDKAREVYLDEASKNKHIIVINANQTPECVYKDIKEALKKHSLTLTNKNRNSVRP